MRLYKNALPKNALPNGFALIATLSILILLTLISMAMLSLSTSTSRTSQISNAQSQAKANARMALMLAIGELQANLGPDQRISADADILEHLSPKNPRWLGVWSSWKAGTSSTGSVDGFSDHSTISGISDDNVAPTYTTGRDDHFIKWLVSMPESDTRNISTITSDLSGAGKFPDNTESMIKLIGDSTAGADSSNHVSVPLIQVTGNDSVFSGRYGWHVSDSSQKSMLIHNDNSQAQSLAGNIFDQSSAPGTGYAHIVGFDSLDSPEDASRIISMPTLTIIEDDNSPNDTLAQKYYHDFTRFSSSVLADVRAGGLKSDLNTLLEREIDVNETSNEFMLYKFDDNNRVPIQDLAAYYQLYDHDDTWSNGRRGGVELTDTSDPIQITTPDAGGSNWRSVEVDRYIKAHNAMYMRPVPIKLHYVAGVSASLLTDEERERAISRDRNGNITRSIDPLDTHRITIGITPTVSLWNPTNMPMVMDIAQIYRLCSPPLAFRWKLYRNSALSYTDWWNNLSACIINESYAGGINPWSPFIANLRLRNETGGTEIVFEPGEVKVFSMEVADGDLLTMTGEPANRIIRRKYIAKPFWDPYGLQTTTNSGVGNSNTSNATNVFKFGSGPSNQNRQLVVRSGDELVLELGNEVINWNLDGGNNSHRKYLGRDMTRGNEMIGSPFNFYLMNETFERRYEQFRNYQMLSRQGGNWSMRNTKKNAEFGGAIMAKGMPEEGTIDDAEYLAVSRDPNQVPLILPAGDNNLKIDVDDVIASSGSGEGRGLFEFFLAAGTEVMAKDSLATGGGKVVPSRPFKHSSIIKPPFISEADNANLYHYGWDWQTRRINDIEESSVNIDQATNKGYWGGGYTPEQGVNNVIQMRLPVAPPTSIASLSHALLGGFSIANQGFYDTDVWPYYDTRATTTTHPLDREHPVKRGLRDELALRRTTAYGAGGLAPFTFQALGDSYAHPNIPADKAFVTKTFTYKKEYLDDDPTSGPKQVPFVDHSYLANKAIWDQYFFSSITDQLDRLGVFETTNKTAKKIATDFFFNKQKLPNKRLITSYTSISKEGLNDLFDEQDTYQDGLADKIASYLMLEGGFNVNSTSVVAWEALLSGLKGEKLNLLLPQANDYKIGDGTVLTDTPVGIAGLQNGDSFSAADLVDANNPINQWTGYRTISDTEIKQLATAIVKQVKLKEPFLSMSDFVNRRLVEFDINNPTLSKLGALQAAIDDPDVSINAHFRSQKERTIGGIGGSNVDSSEFDFPEAIEATDPIAYGSNPYVDQSEILQNIGNQLTVRGDTFIIRAYGDAVDTNGNVLARAWCEAEVQRTSEYIDTTDEAHEEVSNLTTTNQSYGRRFVITQFKWLLSSEI